VKPDTDSEEETAKNVQCWVREDKTEDFDVLAVANNLLLNILLANGNQLRAVKEKDIFIQYQKLYAREFWHNYETRTDKFNTANLANAMKPFRNFVLMTKDQIEHKIREIIEKGE
jgi:hypothetical protein